MELFNESNLDFELVDRIKSWMNPPYDASFKDQLADLITKKDWSALTDAFYKSLAFGTGGMRGLMGPGTNRINTYTIAKATQGFSQYMKKQFPEELIKVVVSYDTRNGSKAFASIVADVFASNGIQVYLFEEMRPTPLLSFAIRELVCHGGVMITASHNPKEYNGYKAYWQDGGQLVAPHDQGVIEEVNKIETPADIKLGANSELIFPLGAEMDQRYFDQVMSLSMRADLDQAKADLRIVYSPIHGTGITLVPELLKRWGFAQVFCVESQSSPNGDFPTVIYPNPEEAEAMNLAIEEGKKKQAAIVLATDPDADRVGMAVRMQDGTYSLLNGNQIGSLLVDYVLTSMHEKKQFLPGDYVAKTIVTTHLIADIADHHALPCHQVLTGFKYIGELMTKLQGEGRFLAGGEESYGYLIGELVRDKDAVVSSALIAEMAAYHLSKGKSIHDALVSLYVKYGYYKEQLISLTKHGKSGAEEIRQIMKKLRSGDIQQLGGYRVAKINDYEIGVARDLIAGKTDRITLPVSDVIQFVTTDGDVISVRPSGTEPKIKFYCSVKEKLDDKSQIGQISAVLDEKIQKIMADILN